jgi:hypothetical protein
MSNKKQKKRQTDCISHWHVFLLSRSHYLLTAPFSSEVKFWGREADMDLRQALLLKRWHEI